MYIRQHTCSNCMHVPDACFPFSPNVKCIIILQPCSLLYS
uniref:Uncharacterized protein n=1 Tax=Anguilla anguilla TaxID=7936 RepID=A0A0E9TVJ8_ANGAN